jgi:subtilase family serine protease
MSLQILRAEHRFVLGAALAIAAVAAAGAARAQAPAQPLIVGAIDENRTVTLVGNTRPEATAVNDRGAVPDSLPLKHILLQLRRPAEREAAFESDLADLTRPGSANYHQWLTAAQIGAEFGPSRSDVDTVVGWLSAHGFVVNEVYPSRMTIDFSGTAGEVRDTFHTAIHRFDVGGVSHIANVRDPRVPAALAPVIAGPVSLHDFRPRPGGHLLPNFTVPGCDLGASTLSSTCYFVTPKDLAAIYDFNRAYAGGNRGGGQTIAVAEDSNIYSASDWFTFRRLFGLDSYAGTLAQTHPPASGRDAACADPDVNKDSFEAILDAEYSGAAAPDAAIEVASCANTSATGGVQIAVLNLVNAPHPPPIISVSYIDCEEYLGAAGNAFVRSTYKQAASEGISVIGIGGDEGPATCDYGAKAASHGIAANGLGSTPYDLAVGGTDFGDVYHHEAEMYWRRTNSGAYGSAVSYIPEIPWNNSCASRLIAKFVSGSKVTYGIGGFCNSARGTEDFLTTYAGSGGPSSCALRDASGDCTGYAKPHWQNVFGNPADGVRDVPDVALFAAGAVWGHAYIVCDSDPSTGYPPCSEFPHSYTYGYGTSFAAPVMAGIMALIDHAAGDQQGNPAPYLYALARKEYGSKGNARCNSTLGRGAANTCIFHNVTEGDNDVPCVPGTPDCFAPSGTYGVVSTSGTAYEPAFPAAPGWNFATGIGSVDVGNLVRNWPRRSGEPVSDPR